MVILGHTKMQGGCFEANDCREILYYYRMFIWILTNIRIDNDTNEGCNDNRRENEH